MLKWELAQSIFQKIYFINGKFKKILKNNTICNYAIRVNYARTQVCDEWSKGGKNGSTMKPENCFRITSKFYETSCNIVPASCVAFVEMNSEIERKHLWESLHTKFVRFAIFLDESIKFVPYMDDYSEPWTDERFVEYFGLTEDEWKVIDETIK